MRRSDRALAYLATDRGRARKKCVLATAGREVRGPVAAKARASPGDPPHGIVWQVFAFDHAEQSLLSPLLFAVLCMSLLRASVLLCAAKARARDLRTVARAKRETVTNQPASNEGDDNTRSA